MIRNPAFRRWILTALVTLNQLAPAEADRKTLVLDGNWQIAEGGMEQSPAQFERTLVVPGLVDMAKPAFEDVGIKSAKREAFWYRRSFQIEGPIPDVALLKVHKAMFGTRVMLNGKTLGDHLPSFTPGFFDAKPALKSGSNEVLIRVGAFRDSVPKPQPDGWDYEKQKFIPGIYDSVEMILSDAPHIARVQIVPDVDNKSVTLHAWLRPAGVQRAAKLNFIVREARSGRVAGERECEIAAEGAERCGQANIT